MAVGLVLDAMRVHDLSSQGSGCKRVEPPHVQAEVFVWRHYELMRPAAAVVSFLVRRSVGADYLIKEVSRESEKWLGLWVRQTDRLQGFAVVFTRFSLA